MKRILPHKLVVSFKPDGTVGSAILQYKMDVDGAVQNKFFTIGVGAALNKTVMSGIASAIKSHAEVGEKI